MKPIINVFSSVIVVLHVLSCEDRAEKEVQLIRPVKCREVGFQGGVKKRTFSGTAQTDKIINLSFRSTGIITQLDIKLGQRVKKGQLLAKLDNVQARLLYGQATTQLNSAISQRNTAKLTLNRVRALYEKGSSSLSDFEAAKNAYKTVKESYESAKRGVEIQREQIRFGYLYAPEPGVIASIRAEINENLSAGQVVATLNAGATMEITLGIPESVINRVKEGMEVDIHFSALRGKKVKGKVTEVAPAVDPNTATYPLRVTIINPSKDIKSGMAADVTFDFGGNPMEKKKLVVPVHAVGEDGKGRFVFIIEAQGKNARVKKQHVTIGNLSSEGFEIISGLRVGQKIATAGLQTLLDGQQVRLP